MKKFFFSILISVFSLQSESSILKEFGEDASSPVTTKAKYVLIAGVATTGILTLYRSQLVKPFQASQSQSQPLGSTSQYGDLLGQLVPNILYVGGMSAAHLAGSKRSGERASGMLKATAFASVVTTLLKYTIRSPRPYNQNVRNSFPSGHTTTAFAFSGYVAAEHGWSWGLPALAMSSFVGFSRINDNRHYLNDVVAGATIGWIFGWGISKVAQKRRAENNKQSTPLRNLPLPTEEKIKEKKDEDDSLRPVLSPIASTGKIGIGIYREF